MEDDLQDDNASGLSTNQDPSSISNIGSATQSAPDDNVSDSLANQDPSIISNIGSATQSASLISITENASAQHILEEKKLPENKDEAKNLESPNDEEVSNSLLSFFGISDSASTLHSEVYIFAKSLQDNEIASFFEHVERAFQALITSMPKQARKHSQSIRGTWLLDSATELMQSFVRAREYSWSPEIKPEELSNTEQQMLARELLADARGADMHLFNDILDMNVHTAYEALPSSAKKCISQTVFRHDFLVEEFYNLLKNFLKKEDLVPLVVAQPSFVFQPAVKIENLLSETLRTQASKVIERVRPEHVPIINARIEELFDQQITKGMPWVPKDLQKHLWESWMLENYYSVVQDICDQNKITSELQNEAVKPVDFVFQPSVKIEDLPCHETRAQAAGIIARVRPEHVARINTRLDELFEEEIKKRMPWASEPLQQNLWSSWLLVNYFGMIQDICDEDKKIWSTEKNG